MKTMSSLLLCLPCLPLLIISLVIDSPVIAQQTFFELPPIPPYPPIPPLTPPPPTSPPPPPPPSTSPPPPPPSTSLPPPPPPMSPPPPPPSTSPPPPTSSPPPPSPTVPKQVRCRSPLFPSCFGQWHSCPHDCSNDCYVDCVSCKPVCSCHLPGALCQDPRFVGGDGLTFYFHGHKNQDFCLLSDRNLHINGHFIGKRNPKLIRDFTWVQSIGILFDNHKLLVGAKKTSTWDDNEEHLYISYDNTPLSLGGKDWNYHNSSLLITRTSSYNGIAIEVKNSFRITAKVVPIGAEESRIHGYNITKDDCYAHLDLRFKFYSLSDVVDGVLGQTYRANYVSKIKVSANMPVMGNIPKYSTSGIFATDCVVSRFGRGNRMPVMDTGKVF